VRASRGRGIAIGLGWRQRKLLPFAVSFLASLVFATAARADLYWWNFNATIGHADTDGTNVNDDFVPAGPSTSCCGVVAVSGQYVFWADGQYDGTIGRADLDGTDVIPDFINTGGHYIDGLAVSGNDLYWSSNAAGISGLTASIGEATVSGGGVDNTFITGAAAYGAIAANDDYLFFTDSLPTGTINSYTSQIGRATVGGGDVDNSLITGIAGLQLTDLAAGSDYVYFGDLPTSTVDIGRATVNGSDVDQSFVPDVDAAGLAIDPDYIYWSGEDEIGRVDIDGSDPDSSLVTGLTDPAGIAAASPSCSLATTSARDGQRARLARAGGPAAHAAQASCGKISISPSTNLKVGGEVTITGTGWDPTNGHVLLSLPGSGRRVSLQSQTPGADGAFTYKNVPVAYFNKRSVYPNVTGGCALSVVATQGSVTAQAQGTSPGMGHVAYADYGADDPVTGAPPFNTGDVYCQGEAPAVNAGDQDVVITVPGTGVPDEQGLIPYQIGAVPFSVNLRGYEEGTTVFPSLKVGGTVCLYRPVPFVGDLVITASTEIGAIANSCGTTWPAAAINSSLGGTYGNVATATLLHGCLEFAASGPYSVLSGDAPRNSVGNTKVNGDLDCNLYRFVGASFNIDAGISGLTRSVFVDGSLRIRYPMVSVTNADLVTAGSLDTADGFSTGGVTHVIVGGDATFGYGGPYLGLSLAEKQELKDLANKLGYVSSGATYAGAVLSTLQLSKRFVTWAGERATGYLGVALGYVSAGTDIKSRLLGAFTDDPPDRHYRAVARPASASGLVPKLTPGGGISPSAANALDALLSSLTREAGLEQAIATAVDRAGGAADTGHTSAQRMQIAAAVHYALSDATLLAAQPKLLKAAARVLRSLRVGRYRPTAHEFAKFRATLAKKGFSRQIIATDHKLGITNSEIDYDREVGRFTAIPARQSAAQIIGNPALASADLKEAAILRAFAKEAPTTVGLRH
jgi:hypothetical protein